MRLTINILLVGLTYFGCLSNCSSQDNGYGTAFHKFVTKFSQEKDIQLKNIRFPLTVIIDNDTAYKGEKEWKLIEYCFGCEYSPILFMGDTIDFQAGYYKIIGDTDYVVSAFIMSEKQIKNFYFKKLGDSWQLAKLCATNIKKEESEFFFDFIYEFAKDTNFVKQRLAENIKYITREIGTDNIIEIPIKIKDFANEEYLFKRIYINNFDLESDENSLYIKGEGTGYHLEYYFKRINKKWYLTKLINTGD
jgi:hypothetical protein